MKKLRNGIEVIATIEGEKLEGTVDTVKGIMIVVEIDGELVNVHHTKVKRVPKETCNRLNFGSRSSKLSDDAVAELRSIWGTISRKAIADMFGISPSYAYKLATGRAAKAVRTSLAA